MLTTKSQAKLPKMVRKFKWGQNEYFLLNTNPNISELNDLLLLKAFSNEMAPKDPYFE
jgi:hypothetical protein